MLATPPTSPLQLGSLKIWPPVVLAPMAGVTDAPFRSLCRSFGAGLYVSEMVTARPFVEGSVKSSQIARFYPDERPRSLQLYGVDPHFIGQAVARLVGEDLVDHIDLNFGCPVPKVTRKGGGCALPLRPRLLAKIIAAAVANAQDIPITIKFRMGISDEYLNFVETGKIAEAEGCKAVALHARTGDQFYEGQARWPAIAELKNAVRSIPVLGNGDIWEASDALAMIAETGCDAVVIGRGCLGRPWLFAELAAAFDGKPIPTPPTLGEIGRIMIAHAQATLAFHPRTNEVAALASFRKHVAWYTKGFRSSSAVRAGLAQLKTLDDLRALVEQLDGDEAFPEAAKRAIRGKSGRAKRVILPHGFLETLDSDAPLEESTLAELSGG